MIIRCVIFFKMMHIKLRLSVIGEIHERLLTIRLSLVLFASHFLLFSLTGYCG